jgi:hypothetical protein
MNHEAVETAAVFSAAFLKEFFSGGARLRRQVQAKLHVLAFKHGDSIRSAVSRIAKGSSSLEDLEFVAYRLRMTQDETAAAYRWLQDNSPKIAKLYSAHYANKVEHMVETKMGRSDPNGIRARIEAMAAVPHLNPEAAKEILVQIDQFNDLLEKLK